MVCEALRGAKLGNCCTGCPCSPFPGLLFLLPRFAGGSFQCSLLRAQIDLATLVGTNCSA
jgi:hypothetical protein